MLGANNERDGCHEPREQRKPSLGVKSGRVAPAPAKPFQGSCSWMSPPVVCGWVAPFFSAGSKIEWDREGPLHFEAVGLG